MVDIVLLKIDFRADRIVPTLWRPQHKLPLFITCAEIVVRTYDGVVAPFVEAVIHKCFHFSTPNMLNTKSPDQ